MSQAASKTSAQTQLEPPRIENGKPLVIAGFRQRYTPARMDGILAQWQRFAPHIGKIPGEISLCAYGLCFDTSNPPQGFEYMTGVEVESASGIPAEFSVVTVPAQRYAIFLHRGHISRLQETFDVVWRKALPESGYKIARAVTGAPDFFEFYTSAFDPNTLTGDIELWIPIQP
jgi:AraC family transcriptional regulator